MKPSTTARRHIGFRFILLVATLVIGCASKDCDGGSPAHTGAAPSRRCSKTSRDLTPALRSRMHQLIEAHREAGKGRAAALSEPASDEALDQLAADLPSGIPAPLRLMWKEHGGQRYTAPGASGIFGYHRLLSPAEARAEYKIHVEGERQARSLFGTGLWQTYDLDYWTPRLVPFAGWDRYVLFMDIDTAEVWEFEPYEGLITHFADVGVLMTEVESLAESDEPYLSGDCPGT